MNPRQITGALGKAARAEDVLSICRDHLRELNHIHVNAALGKLAKSKGLPRHLATDRTFIELIRLARCLSESGHYGARGLSNTMHAIAKMHQIGVLHADNSEVTDLVVAVERRAREVARDMNAQGVANLMWAHATLGRAPGAATWEALERRALEVARDMNPQNVANVMWAHATLGRAPGAATWEALERQALEMARKMTPTQVSDLMWAYATLGRAPGATTFEALEWKALESVRDMTPKEMTNFTWAFSALGRFPRVALKEALERRAAELTRA